MKKQKLKGKGRRHYRNAHGTVYRVKPSYRLTRLNRQRKMMRKLETQLEA